MAITIYYGDFNLYIKNYLEHNVDAVITDPPYDGTSKFLDLTQSICNGNALYFCDAKNQWKGTPDEYLYWIKTPSTKNYVKNCGRFVEMIQVYRKGDTFNQLHWSQMTGVYDDRLVTKPIHPYEKPLSLMERLVRIYTRPGDTVFDPFMGSGTTGLACANLGRNFIGCEHCYMHYELAYNRLRLKSENFIHIEE